MPIICKITLDSDDFKAELDNVIKLTEKLQAEVAGRADSAAEAVATAAEKAVQATQKAAEAPADVANPIEAVGDAVKETVEEIGEELSSSPATGFVDRLKDSFTSLGGSAEGAGTTIKASLMKAVGMGSEIAIIAAGIASLGKIIKTLAVDMPMEAMKDAADIAAAESKSIQEASAAHEEHRTKTDAAAQSLAAFAQKDKLSNLEKEKAVRLIKEMSRGYGDLGISIDEATGKLTGYTAALVRKMEKDRQDRINENKRQQAAIVAAKEAQQAMIDANWLNDASITNAASTEMQRLDVELGKLRTEFGALQRSDPVGDYFADRAAQAASTESEIEDREKKFAQKQKDDAFESSLSGSSARHQAALIEDRIREEEQAVQELNAAVRRLEEASKTGSQADRADALDALLKKRLELLDAQEKLYESQRRLTSAQDEGSKQVYEFLNARKQELEIARLEADAEYERADALRLEKEIRAANLGLTEEELETVRKIQKERNQVSLQTHFSEQGRDLLDNARRMTGRGLQVDYQNAIRAAEQAKRGKLDVAETDYVRQLVDLTRELNNAAKNNPMRGAMDLSIKTNDLTARGGFAGGAVAVSPEKVNQSILNEVKSTAKALRNIESAVNKGLTT